MPKISALGPALFLLLAIAGCASSPAAPSPAGHVETKYSKLPEVIYTPSDWPRALPATIYQPEGPGPWPAVLVVHGGSWSNSDHRWQMSGIARKLARRGYVVMNLTYRGAPEYRYPAPIDDLREAIRWLRANAAKYHVNATRLGAYGFSAGAHLVSYAGTHDAPPGERLQAVVAASAPNDLTYRPGGDIVPRFLGVSYAENPARYRDASPITYVSPDDPPFFLYQGTADKTVSPEQSRRFDAALAAAGVPHELHWLEKRGHAMVLLRDGGMEEKAIDFLDRILRD